MSYTPYPVTAEAETDGLNDGDADADVDTEGETDADGLTDAEADTEALTDGDSDALGLSDGDADADSLTEGDNEGDAEALADTDGLSDADGLTDALADTLGLSDAEGLTDALAEADGLTSPHTVPTNRRYRHTVPVTVLRWAAGAAVTAVNVIKSDHELLSELCWILPVKDPKLAVICRKPAPPFVDWAVPSTDDPVQSSVLVASSWRIRPLSIWPVTRWVAFAFVSCPSSLSTS